MPEYFIVEIESFEGEHTTIDVSGSSGNRTWAMGSLQDGVIVLDDYGYGSRQEAQQTLTAFLRRVEEIKSKA